MTNREKAGALPGTLIADVVRHRRFGPSSVGHDLGTDGAMPASLSFCM
jgi:hypothetical protein